MLPDSVAVTGKERPKYETVLFGGLILLGLSIALSKSANNILLGLLYLAAIYLSVRQRQFRRSLIDNLRQPLLVPLLIYLGVAVLGLLWTSNMTDGIGIVNKLSGLVLAYLAVSVLLDLLGTGEGQAPNGETLLLAFLAGVSILDIIGVLTYFGIVGHRKYFLPLSALNVFHIWFANLNSVALYTAVGFSLYSRFRTSPRARALLLLFFPLAVFSILLSLSRTAWLGIFMTAVVLTFLLVKNKKLMYAMLGGVAISAVLLYFLSGIVHSRIDLIISDISSYSQGQARTNVGERFLMWKAAMRMFRSNPLFGVGTGDYVLTMRNYIAKGDVPEYLIYFNQPHNTYLFALSTNGLVGLAALLSVFVASLRFSLPQLKTASGSRLYAFVGAATCVHYMTAGLTDSFFNIQILRYTFAFVIAVCVRASLRSQGKPAEEEGGGGPGHHGAPHSPA